MLRGFGKFSLLLGGLSLLVVSCAQGPVNPAGNDGQAMAIPMASGEAVLVDEATKQDLIRSARLNGDFRDAESAINRSGKSLDWQERIFGFELKETEGESTHALIIMLKGDTEEELDDAVVSVYFKKRALVGYEVKSVLVTQILERDGNRVVETATADLVSGTGARVIAKPDGQPESGVVGKLTGRRNLDQLATFEPFLPPVESLGEVGALHHPLPPDFPEPDDCKDPADEAALLQAQLLFKGAWDAYGDALDTFNLTSAAAIIGSVGTSAGAVGAVGACVALGPGCTVAAGLFAIGALGTGLGVVGMILGSETIKLAKDNVELALRNYRDVWNKQGCGAFPVLQYPGWLNPMGVTVSLSPSASLWNS